MSIRSQADGSMERVRAKRYRPVLAPLMVVAACQPPAQPMRPSEGAEPQHGSGLPTAGVPDASEPGESSPSLAQPSAASAASKVPTVRQLDARSVASKLPAIVELAQPIGNEGAIPTASIAAALQKASADMFVRYRERDDFPTWIAGSMEIFDEGKFVSYPNGDVSTGHLDAYGGRTHICYAPSATSFLLAYYVGDEHALPDATIGLIWSTTDDGHGMGATVRFVSLEGDTYLVSFSDERPTIDFEVPEADAWPRSLSVPGFGRGAIGWGHRGQLIEKLPDDAVEACADRAWARVEQREGQEGAFYGFASVFQDDCADAIAAWERAHGENMKASVLHRSTLLTIARERAKALGF